MAQHDQFGIGMPQPSLNAFLQPQPERAALQNPQNQAANKEAWKQELTSLQQNPQAMGALMQVGISLMAGRGIRSVNDVSKYLTVQNNLKLEAEKRAFEQEMRRRQVEVDEGNLGERTRSNQASEEQRAKEEQGRNTRAEADRGLRKQRIGIEMQRLGLDKSKAVMDAVEARLAPYIAEAEATGKAYDWSALTRAITAQLRQEQPALFSGVGGGTGGGTGTGKPSPTQTGLPPELTKEHMLNMTPEQVAELRKRYGETADKALTDAGVVLDIQNLPGSRKALSKKDKTEAQVAAERVRAYGRQKTQEGRLAEIRILLEKEGRSESEDRLLLKHANKAMRTLRDQIDQAIVDKDMTTANKLGQELQRLGQVIHDLNATYQQYDTEDFYDQED